jgi:hypothetical protein
MRSNVERAEDLGGLLGVAADVLRRRGQLLAGALHAPGMLEALVAAEVARPEAEPVLRQHYCVTMPEMLRRQLQGDGVERNLFGARLSLSRMPRLRAALEAAFSRVADAGLSCAECLGAPSPAALVEGRTFGEVYAGCHFGSSMPMLYASPADLAEMAARDPLAWIETRYVGPLLHELSHFHAVEPPAPANLHEALAAWIGSEAWPAQVWPEAGALDAIPGAAHFAAVGGWIARTVGPRAALRIQAGALDLRDALGRPCAEALRLYGFLPFLETGAPHLLSDAFRPGRWWKLIDLWREATVARDFHDRLVAPLLAGGAARKQAWDEALDALAWCELPAWRDPPNAIDRDLAARADRALRVRTMRRGQGFVAARADPPGPMVLDREACELQAPWNTPDAFGAPPVFPWPPSLAAQRAD